MGVSEYIKETQGELRRVSWPSRKQVVVSTFAIIVVSVCMALLLGVFDFIFSSTLGKILVEGGGTRGQPTLPVLDGAPSVAPASLGGTPININPAEGLPGNGPMDANKVLPTLPDTGGL